MGLKSGPFFFPVLGDYISKCLLPNARQKEKKKEKCSAVKKATGERREKKVEENRAPDTRRPPDKAPK